MGRGSRVAAALVGAALWSTTLLGAAGPAAAAAPTVQGCLDGDHPPHTVIAEHRFSGRTYTLRCGSPISYGLLHIDDDHPITSPSEFLACFRKIVFEGHDSPNGTVGSRYPSRHLNVVTGRVAARMIYEIGGNVVTIYTSGAGGSANFRACANA